MFSSTLAAFKNTKQSCLTIVARAECGLALKQCASYRVRHQWCAAQTVRSAALARFAPGDKSTRLPYADCQDWQNRNVPVSNTTVTIVGLVEEPLQARELSQVCSTCH